jgi:hypothetical protein
MKPGLLCALAIAACDEGDGPPPPTPIPQELRLQKPDPRGPPSGPPGAATQKVEAPPKDAPLSVLLTDTDVELGVGGTLAQATAWSLKRAGDPTAATGSLDPAALAKLWEQLEATGWRKSDAKAGATLRVTRGAEQQASALAPDLAAASRTFRTAAATGLTPLSGATTVIVPARPRASADAPSVVCHESAVVVTCDVVADHGPHVCYPTRSPGTLDCLAEPWAKTGTVVRSKQSVVLPLRYAQAWAAEVGKNVTCQSTPDDVTVLSCSDGTTLTGVVAGKTRWLAHLGRPNAVGPPVVLTRVFPASGQLLPGEKPGALGEYELRLTDEGGTPAHSARGALSGDARSARGWLLNASGDSAASLRQGAVPPAHLKALWAKLNALHWSELGPGEGDVAEPLRVRLVIAAGGVELALPTNGCRTCRAGEAVAALRAALDALPPAKWKTQVVEPALLPPKGTPATGLCAQDMCTRRGETTPRLCTRSSAAHVYHCPSGPWDKKGFFIKPDQSDLQQKEPPDVWGVELESGTRCALNSARKMTCNDASTLVELSQGPGQWLAMLAGPDGKASPRPVTTLWLTARRDAKK